MTGFNEVRFPTDVALGARGGPERRTDVVTLRSGAEERNSLWADARRKYQAGYGVKSFAQLEAVLAFFEAQRGRLYGFRWKDRFDYRSCASPQAPGMLDQLIGTGDGTTAVWQLTKTYAAGLTPYVRPIRKPVVGTVSVAVGGVAVTIGTGFTVDVTTGLVTFVPGHIPAAGAAITAGFQFDVPVRFDTDYLEVDLSHFEAGEIPNIPIVEIRV
ncbi:DUF2460 domain-containing protein [Lichenifustis flavocetrariae]|uniref:DUF2460 domain-containing protein n=1 Tax=Lichenifustis flavocetrariae TaxID=2949735 RepID=A0AA41Z5Q3_9HYPH|nr:DUF2460 domain-containing protein [Lichenifustis flavocetrariae]MCW6510988.1 DUF2460 domain-containing protein [Lichenifustis flavocetrariae]